MEYKVAVVSLLEQKVITMKPTFSFFHTKALIVLILMLGSSMAISQGFYGVYHEFEKGGAKLLLETNGTYVLSEMEYSDYLEAVEEVVISSGEVQFKGDMINLKSTKGNMLSLSTEVENKLGVIESSGVFRPYENFLIEKRFYDTGEVHFRGFWKKRKQHGVWSYYNENGTIDYSILYKGGKETSRKIGKMESIKRPAVLKVTRFLGTTFSMQSSN